MRQHQAGGAIALANPVTGAMLAIPPLPCDGLFTNQAQNWHEAYSFAYHPVTGKYTVVHVPCSFDRLWEFDKVQTFTLGKKSWRDVAVAVPRSTRCSLVVGLMSVDGSTYWVTEGTEKVMSFNHEDESVMFIKPLPMQVKLVDLRLTEVRGRLGIAVTHDTWTLKNIEVYPALSRRDTTMHHLQAYTLNLWCSFDPCVGVGSRVCKGGTQMEPMVQRADEDPKASVELVAAARAASFCSW